MIETGHNSPLFGISLLPSAASADRTLAQAQLADRAGLDLLAMQDHPYNPAFLDTWTLLAVIGAQTQRIRLLTDVANLPLRPPAVLAKAAASLDRLTGGRFELGLGAGWNWDGIASYGGPRRTPGAALQALEEAIQVIRTVWQPLPEGAAADFAGRVYSLEHVQPGPAPEHRIGIWLGAYKPRILALTGRLADGWIPSAGNLPPANIPAAQQLIDDAASRAGRDPGAIRRAYNLGGAIQIGQGAALKPSRPGVLVGDADFWAKELIHYIQDLHLDTFIFYPISQDLEDQIQAFAERVVPAVREAVGV